MMAQAHAASGPAHAEEHQHTNYVKIWAILLGLLILSVLGPLLGHPLVTLITAFGIAVVKAGMVAKYFMHITIEKRYIMYIVSACLVFMLLFFAGSAPDVMKDAGSTMSDGAAQWEKPAYHVVIPLEPEAGGERGAEHAGH